MYNIYTLSIGAAANIIVLGGTKMFYYVFYAIRDNEICYSISSNSDGYGLSGDWSLLAEFDGYESAILYIVSRGR